MVVVSNRLVWPDSPKVESEIGLTMNLTGKERGLVRKDWGRKQRGKPTYTYQGGLKEAIV